MKKFVGVPCRPTFPTKPKAVLEESHQIRNIFPFPIVDTILLDDPADSHSLKSTWTHGPICASARLKHKYESMTWFHIMSMLLCNFNP